VCVCSLAAGAELRPARSPCAASRQLVRRRLDAVLVNGRTSAAHRENYTECGYTPHL